MQNKTSSIKVKNKKAYADFNILETLEAGIVLTGPEVKSITYSRANLKGSYIDIDTNNEAYIKNAHISKYKHAQNQQQYNPTAKRKLLLHKKEIKKLQEKQKEPGITLIPLDFHISHNKIKVTIGICKGKKKYDKRNDLKKRAQNLEIKRTLKHF